MSSARFPHLALLLVLLIAAATAASAIGQRDLWPPDEPKYTLIAREMVESGDYVHPRLNGEPYPDKPPLMFWAIAASSLVTGGFGQPAAILPSILASLLVLLATARLAWLLDGRRRVGAPLLAAGLLLVAYRFLSQATVGQIDMVLTACTTWAFLLLVDGLGLAPGRPESAKRVVGAFALMGLGILAKGPVALICPLGGVLLGAACAGAKIPWRGALRLPAWAALAGVVALWLVPAAFGAFFGAQLDWLTDILFKQTAVRFARSWHHHQPFWYMGRALLYDFIPITLLLPGALWRLLAPGERERPAAWRLLAGAALFVLLFFSIPRGKRGVYLMPLYPWLAVWIGLDLEDRLERGGRSLWGVRLPALVGGGILLGAAAAAPSLLAPKLAEEAIALSPWVVVPGLAAAGLGTLSIGIWPRARRAFAAALVGWMLFYATAYGQVFRAINPRRSAKLFVAEIHERVVPGAQGGMLDFRAQFGFYAGRLDARFPEDPEGPAHLAARLSAPEPFWLIVRERQVPLITEHLAEGVELHELLAREVGHKELVVLANRAALRSPPPRESE